MITRRDLDGAVPWDPYPLRCHPRSLPVLLLGSAPNHHGLHDSGTGHTSQKQWVTRQQVKLLHLQDPESQDLACLSLVHSWTLLHILLDIHQELATLARTCRCHTSQNRHKPHQLEQISVAKLQATLRTEMPCCTKGQANCWKTNSQLGRRSSTKPEVRPVNRNPGQKRLEN